MDKRINKNTTRMARQIIERSPENTPHRTMAKELCASYPTIFPNIERARSSLRYVTGRSGISKRAKLKDKNLMRTPDNTLPEPTHEDFWEPFIIKQEHGFVVADMHIPFHSTMAIKRAFDVIKKNGADFILLDGDVWDGYALSDFRKDASMIDLTAEAIKVRQMLAWIRGKFPKTDIYYKEANHDARYRKELHQKNPAIVKAWHDIAKSEERCPDSLTYFLGLDKLGITMIDWKKPVKFGALTILHGDELGSGGITVNPARTAYLKTKDCCMVAHSHRPSSHTEKTLGNYIVTCWSIGCLCNLHPFYAPVNNWVWGFAELTQNNKSGFSVSNKKILGNGEVYDA